MISPKNITKLTAVGLAVGAFAAPAASAMPFGGIPTQASQQRPTAGHQVKYLAQARQLKSGSSRLFYRNVSASQLAADLAPPPRYSRQDKALVPSSPSQAPTSVPATVRHANPSGTSDWTYAAIGAGGAAVVVLFGVGGPLALQRRRRPTVKPAAASAS